MRSFLFWRCFKSNPPEVLPKKEHGQEICALFGLIQNPKVSVFYKREFWLDSASRQGKPHVKGQNCVPCGCRKWQLLSAFVKNACCYPCGFEHNCFFAGSDPSLKIKYHKEKLREHYSSSRKHEKHRHSKKHSHGHRERLVLAFILRRSQVCMSIAIKSLEYP